MLSWIFFRKELRQRIEELKISGNLREEAYQNLHHSLKWHFRSIIALFLVGITLMSVVGDISVSFSLMVIVPIAALAIFTIRYGDVGAEVNYYTLGMPMIAKVESFRLDARAIGFIAWLSVKIDGVEHRFMNSGQMSMMFGQRDKSSSLENPKMKFSCNKRFKKGDFLPVFIIPNKPSKGRIYYSDHFPKYCLDEEQFERSLELIKNMKEVKNA